MAAPGYAAVSKLEDYFKESWTTRDGLPHNTINSIRQTADGYLWLATWEGVVRYNGRQFKVFGRDNISGLPDSGARVLTLDHHGELLVGGARGGLAKNGDSGWFSWPAFPALVNDVMPDNNGRLWVATEGHGLFLQFADGHRQQFTEGNGLPSNIVYTLFIDQHNMLWVGTANGLVFIDPELKLHPFTALSSAPVFVLASNHQGELLVGSGQGLFLLQADKARLLLPELENVPVSELLVEQDVIWIGTVDRGLLRLSEHGLEQLNIERGLPNNRILALFMDREQSLWVGTNGGLFRLRDAPFTSYNTEKGLADNYVRSVLSHSDGSLWIGTSRGLNRMVGRKLETIELGPASRGQSVLSLAEDKTDGSVWIGTYSDGLIQWHNGQIKAHYNHVNGLAADEVRAILPLDDGSLWVGTANGLNYIHQQQIRFYGTEHGLPGSFIMALHQTHDGRLFIGTGVGVAIIQQDNIRALDFSGLDNAEYAFGFAEDKVANILWMTTDRGLLCYQLDSGKMALIGRNAGIPFDKLFQLVIDKQQFFWISTNRGILRLTYEQVMAVALGLATGLKVELFGESDGMESAQANGGSSPAATMHHDGSVWIATSAGVTTVQPDNLKRFSAVVPPVVIEELMVNSQSYNWQGVLQLPAGSSRIELKFAGLGFIMPQRIQYRTRLEGFDSDWVERGTLNFAEYTNLSPGHYKFRVSASYPQGAWSEDEAVLEFSITPFWWQRSGFWLLLLLAVISLTVLAVRWRLANLRHSELRLKRQVAAKTAVLQQQADELRAANQEKSELVERLRVQSEAFERQARLDGLTGLANRRAFDEALQHEYLRASRSQQPLSLALLDIDHFKLVNDNWSHTIGDEVLKCVAREIKLHCRQTDTVARWGGEEFAILLPETSLAQAAEMSERLREAIAAIDCTAVACQLKVTVSIGVAEHTGTLHTRQLLSKADEALYKAKQAGRDQVMLTH
ncbi:diguanylate cyclase [Chromatiaceae bacterium AAb-1]|nr:diguanylate cyclase [Chromatiaceae bacterium AAb-1]